MRYHGALLMTSHSIERLFCAFYCD